MIEYKDYKIKMMGTFSLYEIKPKAQGQVPAELRGTYTSREKAILAIDSYKPKREKKNVKVECTI